MKVRVPPPAAEALSEEQRAIASAIAGSRGGVGGPFALWLRIPEIARRANHFSERIRLQTTLDRRLFELMVTIVARTWSAPYEWSAHADAAVKCGVSPAVVEAIRQRRVPPFERDDERVVYDTVTELLQTRALATASYERALALFGTEGLIEFMTAVGWYTMIAVVLCAFDVPAPPGAAEL